MGHANTLSRGSAKVGPHARRIAVFLCSFGTLKGLYTFEGSAVWPRQKLAGELTMVPLPNWQLHAQIVGYFSCFLQKKAPVGKAKVSNPPPHYSTLRESNIQFSSVDFQANALVVNRFATRKT